MGYHDIDLYEKEDHEDDQLNLEAINIDKGIFYNIKKDKSGKYFLVKVTKEEKEDYDF